MTLPGRLFRSLLFFLLLACSGKHSVQTNRDTGSETARRDSVLERLREDINRVYGFVEGDPRINRGPCGRFARDFREQWNEEFNEKVNIVFAMTPDRSECYHVLVKLPGGSYYDGGNGVMSELELHRMYSQNGVQLDEMKDFDYYLLDKWSYGLTRDYPLCPNYSDDTTRTIIARHLAEVKRQAVTSLRNR